MKKWIAIFLLLSMALPLCGCVPEWPKDTFYRADILAECDLSDLPVPKLENSRLGGEYLYCNLTQEEYETYVAELLAYLRGREDIHHLSYQHSRHLIAEMWPIDVCVPLPEDCPLVQRAPESGAADDLPGYFCRCGSAADPTAA